MSAEIIQLTAKVRSKYKRTNCKHRTVVIDPQTHACECEKCGEHVSATWFLLQLADRWATEERAFEYAKQQRKEIENYKPWLKAVKALEHIWRGRDKQPICPHCRKGISAETLASTGWIRVKP